MLLATTVVALVPALSAWWLRNEGIVRSALLCLFICILLSLTLSIVGAAYWKRRHAADIMFSELLVWGWCRRLWRERQLRNVPALVESAINGGHSDQLTVNRRRRMLAQLSAAIEAQDPYIDGHSRRVARHSEMIAAKMRLPEDEVARIRTAAALHDVGKLSTPRDVLSKPGRLTDREFEVVKRHARDGALMVTCLEDPELTAIVECHHERLDGSGYPDGLHAAEIPLGARIVAVADIFDAITAPRPYRPAAPHQRAFAVLSSEEGTRLDSEVVHAFVDCYSGRRTVALWGALSALGVSLLARTKGLLARRRLSLRDLMNSTTAMAAAAAAAVAAPLSAQPPHRLPSPTPVAAAPASVILTPPAHAARRPRHHQRRASAAAVRRTAGHRAAVRHRSPAPARVTRTTSPPPSATHTTPPSRHHPPAGKPPARSTPPPKKTVPASPPPTTTTTTAPPPATGPLEPTSKQQCMHGGWGQFRFPNQGQCIDWVVHHGG